MCILQGRVEKSTMASGLNCTCCLSELTTFCNTLSDLSDLTIVAIWAILHFIAIWTTGGNCCRYLSYNTLSTQSIGEVDYRGCRSYTWIFIKCQSWLLQLSELQFLNLINCRALILQLSELNLLVPLLQLYNFVHVDPLH